MLEPHATDASVINKTDKNIALVFIYVSYHIAPNIAVRIVDDVFTALPHAASHAAAHAASDAYVCKNTQSDTNGIPIAHQQLDPTSVVDADTVASAVLAVPVTSLHEA